MESLFSPSPAPRGGDLPGSAYVASKSARHHHALLEEEEDRLDKIIC
jgi:hypothetical protein